jgi:hypothetical protein
MPNSSEATWLAENVDSPQPNWTGAPSLFAPTISSIATNLFSWGNIQFELQPFNIHEYDHETASDWAQKQIAGAPVYREWVGENDEIISFRGRVFPYRIGGMGKLPVCKVSPTCLCVAMVSSWDGLSARSLFALTPICRLRVLANRLRLRLRLRAYLRQGCPDT